MPRVANILPATADELGLEDQEGVVIVAVKEDSTSARLGFRTGDVIVQVGRKRIETVVELEAALRARQQLWQIALKRGEQIIQLQVPG